MSKFENYVSEQGGKLLDIGRRNNDAVNLCILYYVDHGFDGVPHRTLRNGVTTVNEPQFAEAVCKELDRLGVTYDEDDFSERAETIAFYLDNWGPKGKEDQAQSYMIHII